MKRKSFFNSALYILNFMMLSLIIATIGLYFMGARINTSNSIAEGLYWTSSKPVAKGEYVIFCPPKRKIFDEAMQRGYIGSSFCPGGYGYMMKLVDAKKGDVISETAAGVFINGKLLPLSKPFAHDGLNRPLPILHIINHTLGKSELLLMTDRSPISFDSRYFGTINQSQIKSVIRPIFTW